MAHLGQVDKADTCSCDSQFVDTQFEEVTFLEVCVDCDEDALYDMVTEGCLTPAQVNERDQSGKTGISHVCANGFLNMLDILADLDCIDVNLADNDANTPLVFAAQAGHADVMTSLIDNFRDLQIDQRNRLGFTALMKAAVQGRTKCAKLLLFAGACGKLKDYGRGYCAEEWAKFCSRKECHDAISKYEKGKFSLSRITKHLRTSMKGSHARPMRRKSTSVPDFSMLQSLQVEEPARNNKRKRRSFKEKIRRVFKPENHDALSMYQLPRKSALAEAQEALPAYGLRFRSAEEPCPVRHRTKDILELKIAFRRRRSISMPQLSIPSLLVTEPKEPMSSAAFHNFVPAKTNPFLLKPTKTRSKRRHHSVTGATSADV